MESASSFTASVFSSRPDGPPVLIFNRPRDITWTRARNIPIIPRPIDSIIFGSIFQRFPTTFPIMPGRRPRTSPKSSMKYFGKSKSDCMKDLMKSESILGKLAMALTRLTSCPIGPAFANNASGLEIISVATCSLLLLRVTNFPLVSAIAFCAAYHSRVYAWALARISSCMCRSSSV